MSKHVKELIKNEFAERLKDVEDALLVDVIGLDANSSVTLRKQLREKNISLMVVKNGLAKRATEGTPLAPALDNMDGSLAFVWGAEDFISLTKEIAKLDADVAEFENFKTRGGVMDGEQLTPERVKEISKWPSRAEQLSIVSGQLLSPGANLSGALLGPGGAVASQIESKAEGEE